MNNVLNNERIILLTEGAYYPTSFLKSGKTFDILSNLGLIITDRQTFFKPKFVGLIFVNGSIIIVFPKNWNTQEYTIKDVNSLILAILKYQRNVKTGITDDPVNSDLGLMNNQIKAAFWLLFDYIDNGILKRSKEKLTYGSFIRTSWNRTVKKTNPWFTCSGPIYLNPIQKVSIDDKLSEISYIHQVAIALSYKRYGWLIESEIGELQEILDLDNDVEEHWKSRLESELVVSFIEREQLVLKNIIFLLFEDNEGQISNQFGGVYTTNTFNFWEEMCGYAFENEYSSLASLIPKPEWNWDNRVIHGDEQIPDILFIYSNQFYLLDAKYYTAPRDLPGVQDIVKQLFYEMVIANKFTDAATRPHINNIFLFPASTIDPLKKRGKVSLDNISGIEEVLIITLDVKNILEHYIGKQSVNYRKLLLEAISER